MWMKQFTGFIRKICHSEKVYLAVRMLAMAFMMFALYLYLLQADYSTAPDFIYSQF